MLFIEITNVFPLDKNSRGVKQSLYQISQLSGKSDNGDGTVALMFFQCLKNETGQLVALAEIAKQGGKVGKFNITLSGLPDHPVPREYHFVSC